jgi:tetratricopeptide (TPR) repeat protein
MKQQKYILSIILILSLTLILSCSFMQNNTSPTIEETSLPKNTSTSSATPSLTFTHTPSPSPTITPTQTVTYTPSIYPSPQGSYAVSVASITPGIPARCPAVNTSIEVDLDKILQIQEINETGYQYIDIHIEALLNILNQGVPLDTIVNAIPNNDLYDEAMANFNFADVTGDGIDEIIYTTHAETYVYGCMNNEYQELQILWFDFGTMSIPEAMTRDTNNNGLLEVVVYNTGCFSNSCYGLGIYEWDGQQFQDLFGDSCTMNIYRPDNYAIKDIDNNGTLEVIINFGIGPHVRDIISYPLRNETLICMWNGEAYDAIEDDFSPLIYRFEAVQDGNRQLRLEHYERAIEFYEKAINDESLEWFSKERRLVEYDNYTYKLFSDINPDLTPTPAIVADPDEYPSLASFSYFRIILAYLLMDDLPSAESIYAKMEETSPDAQIGGHYTHMANLLLESYRETANIQQGCSIVSAYANENEDELDDQVSFFEWADRYFWVRAICPYYYVEGE